MLALVYELTVDLVLFRVRVRGAEAVEDIKLI